MITEYWLLCREFHKGDNTLIAQGKLEGRFHAPHYVCLPLNFIYSFFKTVLYNYHKNQIISFWLSEQIEKKIMSHLVVDAEDWIISGLSVDIP